MTKEITKETKASWESEFDRRFLPHDTFGLGEHNLRIKGRASEVKQFIREHFVDNKPE